MNALVPYIWVAGGIHFLIAVANLPLPRILNYRENLRKVPPIIRQIFVIHSVYIVLVVIGFGLLCVLFASDLTGGHRLGRFVSGGISVFWIIRIPIQLFYYDPDLRRRYRLVDIGFTLAPVYLGGVLGLAALGIFE